jgi:hypothetical protein
VNEPAPFVDVVNQGSGPVLPIPVATNKAGKPIRVSQLRPALVVVAKGD